MTSLCFSLEITILRFIVMIFREFNLNYITKRSLNWNTKTNTGKLNKVVEQKQNLSYLKRYRKNYLKTHCLLKAILRRFLSFDK